MADRLRFRFERYPQTVSRTSEFAKSSAPGTLCPMGFGTDIGPRCDALGPERGLEGSFPAGADR